jgi:membrane protease YdiL (CAAX protease family)
VVSTLPESPAPRGGLPGDRRIRIEILIVLGLSLGLSAVYSLVAIINRLTRDVPLSDQTATLNPSRSERPVFDLIYQLLAIIGELMPVALVIFLLWNSTRPHLGRLGIDGAHPWRDTRDGIGLALLIGVPGLALYLAGRALGLTVTVVPAALDEHWWTVPVLLLSAARAGIVEEVIVVGYLFARLRDLRWGPWTIILTSALLRATYHLYQGFGAFVGNFVMGLVFGWLYTRYGRLLPLVIAHTLIDAAVFVGYAWAAATFPGLLAPTPSPSPTPTP